MEAWAPRPTNGDKVSDPSAWSLPAEPSVQLVGSSTTFEPTPQCASVVATSMRPSSSGDQDRRAPRELAIQLARGCAGPALVAELGPDSPQEKHQNGNHPPIVTATWGVRTEIAGGKTANGAGATNTGRGA